MTDITKSFSSDDTQLLVDLSRLEIPDATVIPVPAPDTLYGVGISAINDGLKVFVAPYRGMAISDDVEIYWGSDPVPVATISVDESNLNKPLGFSIPESYFNPGDFSVKYVVKRQSSVVGEGLPLPVRVKLTYPGGLDPDPSTPAHELLSRPLLPDDIPPEGLTSDYIRGGVPVTVRPWANMAEYDELTLSWGGQLINRRIQASDISREIIITVPEQTILDAGDGDILIIYKVTDCAANRSLGWSLPTTVPVFASNASLAAPLIVKANNGFLDLGDLSNQPAAILAATSGDAARAGDILTFNWNGTTADNTAVNYSDWVAIQTPPSFENFAVPYEKISAISGGQAVAFCTLQTSIGPVTSKRSQVQIKGAVATLPAPTVAEENNGSLQPDLEKASVIVPPWQGMQSGDEVILRWDGEKATGEPFFYSDRVLLTGAEVGKNVVFSVAGENISILSGGKVTVYYQLNSILGRSADIPSALRPSEKLHLSVGAGQVQLKKPFIEEAVNNVIDSSLASVTARIDPYSDMKALDVVTLWWKKDAGAPAYANDITVPASQVGQALKLPVQQAQYAGSSQAEIYYTVRHSGDANSAQSESLYLSVRDGGAVLPPFPEPSIPEAVAGSLSGDLNSATILVSSASGLKNGDWVTGHFNGELTGAVQAIQDNQSVSLTITRNMIINAQGKQAEVFYTVQRGNQPGESRKISVTVTQPAVQPSFAKPTLLEASNGLIDLSLPEAHLLIASSNIPAEQLKQNDSVFARMWTTLNGTRYETAPPVIVVTDNAPLSVTIGGAYLQALAGLNPEGGINFLYSVTRGGIAYDSVVLTLLPAESGSISFPEPVVPQANGGVLDGSLTQAILRVQTSAGLKAGDTVTGYFNGSNIGSQNVSQNNQQLEFTISQALISAAQDKTVNVYYSVKRNNKDYPSSALSLVVTSGSASFPAPSVPLANSSNIITRAQWYNIKNVAVRVPASAALKPGMRVQVFWKGRSEYKSPRISVPSSGTLDVLVPRMELIDAIGTGVTVSYEVFNSNDYSLGVSANHRITIDGQGRDLIAPDVSADFLTVTVRGAGINRYDDVYATLVILSDTPGEYTEYKTAEKEYSGSGTLTFNLPSSWFTGHSGKYAYINYGVVTEWDINMPRDFSQVKRFNVK
ncbi:hypothetical protein [Enterobacter roggenkampii]|uniref:hypothetical protein n=1 Tax=Enterobacter roggenkampii TaxID=1812935 RepID=UPI002FF9425F